MHKKMNEVFSFNYVQTRLHKITHWLAKSVSSRGHGLSTAGGPFALTYRRVGYPYGRQVVVHNRESTGHFNMCCGCLHFRVSVLRGSTVHTGI